MIQSIRRRFHTVVFRHKMYRRRVGDSVWLVCGCNRAWEVSK